MLIILLADYIISNDEKRSIHHENLRKSSLNATNNLDKKSRKVLELPQAPA